MQSLILFFWDVFLGLGGLMKTEVFFEVWHILYIFIVFWHGFLLLWSFGFESELRPAAANALLADDIFSLLDNDAIDDLVLESDNPIGLDDLKYVVQYAKHCSFCFVFQALVEGIEVLPAFKHVFTCVLRLCSFRNVWEQNGVQIVPGWFFLESMVWMKWPGIIFLFDKEALLRSEHEIQVEQWRCRSILDPW